MTATTHEQFQLQNAEPPIAVYRWGVAVAGRPSVLMTHGTGFCAAVWQDVAQALAEQFTVYAIDRRGHGASGKPADAYHFADFAQDAVGVIDGLQLTAAYAIGHSAGATDLLLAAAARPAAFRCIFAIEPTIRVEPQPSALSEGDDERLTAAARRRATFVSFDEVFERYRARDAFRAWRPELLRAYVQHGFELNADGSVSLRCRPEIERAILVHIVNAMAGSYRGDDRGDPFALLSRIGCPTRVATTERSQAIYKQMAEMALRSIRDVSAHHFEGVGHSVAQVQPEAVVRAARRFWDELEA